MKLKDLIRTLKSPTSTHLEWIKPGVVGLQHLEICGAIPGVGLGRRGNRRGRTVRTG